MHTGILLKNVSASTGFARHCRIITPKKKSFSNYLI